MSEEPDKSRYKATAYGSTAKPTRWVAFVSGRTSTTVDRSEEDAVMSWPHLIIREVILIEVLLVVLIVCALWFNAPLEELANPEYSPNPAKAPWYFLGLQELLHYFPPVIAGVLIPFLSVVSLVALPYARSSLYNRGLWAGRRGRTLAGIGIGTFVLALLTVPFGAWAVLVPSLLVVSAMLVPYGLNFRTPLLQWWAQLSLADWLMIWFVCVAVTLTCIGVFFRGPEWQWVWPWRDGIY